jgi:TolA-binding protein
MTMKSITSSLAALVLVALTPGIAPGQSAGSSAYVDDRLNQISRSIADLQGRMEQLRKQNQQLQQSLDKMRSSYESRLTRLEKGGAAKPPTPRSGQSQR